MSKVGHRQYHHYLLTKSRKAVLYHQYFVYPRIRKRLGRVVLDVGCGVGYFLDFMRSAVGVDVNFYNLRYCRRRGHDVCLIKDESYPFRDKTFDSAVMDNVLEHLREPRGLLAEICRILKIGGSLVVGVPGKRGFQRDNDHKVYYDTQSLIRLLTSAGFRVDEVFHAPFRWAWLNHNARMYCLYGVFRRQS